MDIDMTALRLVEHERGISLDTLVGAIEQALLSAYHRTPGAHESARVEVDRRTGHVTVWARERLEGNPEHDSEHDSEHDLEGGPGHDPEQDPGHDSEGGPERALVDAAPTWSEEFEHTPEGFGRVATATARQVIVQRLRDVEDEQVLGAFRGAEGEILAGVVQQGRDPRTVLVAVRGTEAVLPHHEQVPTETYVHGERLRAYVLDVSRGPKGPSITLSRTHPGLVRKLFELEVPEVADGSVEIMAIAREAGHRTKIAVRIDGGRAQRQGRVHRPDGGAGAGRDGRAARREDRHRRPRRRPGAVRGHALSPARVTSVTVVDAAARSARVVVPDYQLSLAIGKEGQNARLAAKLTGWRIDIRSDEEGPPTLRTDRRRPRRTPSRLGRARRGPGSRFVTRALDSAALGPGPAPRARGRRHRRRGSRRGPDEAAAGPVRTCVGCRERGPRSVLVRVVRVDGDGQPRAVVDPGRSLPGRGAWLHADLQCLELAERRRALPRALRTRTLDVAGAPGVRSRPRLAGPGARRMSFTASSRVVHREGKRVGSRWAPDEYPAMSTQH